MAKGGQKSSCRHGHQTMTMTNNNTTTMNASFFDEHSMIVYFQSCQNGPSFTVAIKLLLWLVVVAVAHNHRKFSDECSIVDVRFQRNTLLFSMAAKSPCLVGCCCSHPLSEDDWSLVFHLLGRVVE
jgi:hypothetical protein